MPGLELKKAAGKTVIEVELHVAVFVRTSDLWGEDGSRPLVQRGQVIRHAHNLEEESLIPGR